MQPTISADLVCVRVEHLRGSSVASLMSDMRTWLDHKGIQPKEFKAITLPFGSVAFDVEFHHADQATLFRAAFAPNIELARASSPESDARDIADRSPPGFPVGPLYGMSK